MRRPLAIVLITGAAALAASGCGDGADHRGGHNPAHVGSPRPPAARQPAGHRRRAAHRPGPSTAAGSACPPPARTLDGVYHPARLAVRDPCRRVTGTVMSVTPEEDGDLHFDVHLDPAHRGMLMPGNHREQGGGLVVELMPRDRGHLPAPSVGDRVTILGAYVDDTEHAWAELHPVFGLAIDGAAMRRSGPQFGGSPGPARSDDALATCRTAAGARCGGYGGSPAVARSPGGGTGPRGDRDCADFATQADAQRYFRANGGPTRDPSGLDADHDGVACEDLP